MLKEKVENFLNSLFNDWVNLACDDFEEMESYKVDDPKDYARARTQEIADDLDNWFTNEFEFYDNGNFIGYDVADIKEEVKKQLTDQGYDVK